MRVPRVSSIHIRPPPRHSRTCSCHGVHLAQLEPAIEPRTSRGSSTMPLYRGQVARVVKGYRATRAGDEAVASASTDPESTARQQLAQERRVMHDPEVAAELAVLVADRVEAVRARGHDRPLAHAGSRFSVSMLPVASIWKT
jgi:hypothetical protein